MCYDIRAINGLLGQLRPFSLWERGERHERRHPSQLRTDYDPLCLWQRLHDRFHQEGHPRWDLLQVPPFLYRQAEAGWHRWTCWSFQQEIWSEVRIESVLVFGTDFFLFISGPFNLWLVPKLLVENIHGLLYGRILYPPVFYSKNLDIFVVQNAGFVI